MLHLYSNIEMNYTESKKNQIQSKQLDKTEHLHKC